MTLHLKMSSSSNPAEKPSTGFFFSSVHIERNTSVSTKTSHIFRITYYKGTDPIINEPLSCFINSKAAWDDIHSVGFLRGAPSTTRSLGFTLDGKWCSVDICTLLGA
jgi:hypothetical protein